MSNSLRDRFDQDHRYGVSYDSTSLPLRSFTFPLDSTSTIQRQTRGSQRRRPQLNYRQSGRTYETDQTDLTENPIPRSYGKRPSLSYDVEDDDFPDISKLEISVPRTMKLSADVTLLIDLRERTAQTTFLAKGEWGFGTGIRKIDYNDTLNDAQWRALCRDWDPTGDKLFGMTGTAEGEVDMKTKRGNLTADMGEYGTHRCQLDLNGESLGDVKWIVRNK
ncbi:hypothetical protein TREMEDRAFT_64864 [Tremella mesenterica DSM 1558]|uniref:uncharacterized protein n=1 Tax=Tremella mesenterica (strain ATCC 24925 / CBS 8224 / DSM 1558 / NBRC 9311 / NRRL Y-6157 / RJB 2259-6 / UBC 559-6) TaxID=578456 RepID=UPI0003F491EA|nr:uncharacterized protein TREMEDRAFT_64864 [Tremella mesenterica DSM 1558]EIW66998.1 hypothetical protein TREMEDRAFT_64864 [Tremella mesenterica DSM 1558]